MSKEITAEKLLTAFERAGIPAPPIEALELVVQELNKRIMKYRLLDKENQVSPCPNKIWETRESAEEGLRFWQMKYCGVLEIVEEE